MNIKENIKNRIDDYKREKEQEKKLENEIYERKKYAYEMEKEKEKYEKRRENAEKKAEFRASGGLGGAVVRGLKKGGSNFKGNIKHYGAKAGKLAGKGFKKASKMAYSGVKKSINSKPKQSKPLDYGMRSFDIFGGSQPAKRSRKSKRKSQKNDFGFGWLK